MLVLTGGALAALEDGTRLGVLAQKNPNNPSWRPVDEKLVVDPWGQEYFICLDDLGQKQICSYGRLENKFLLVRAPWKTNYARTGALKLF